MSAASLHRVGRRWVLVQAGKGALGLAVLGVAACAGDSRSSEQSSSAVRSAPSGPPDPPASGSETAAGALTWSRVDLGFVAAYVLVRGQEAAVVDTGEQGGADAIGQVLDEAGPGWAGVRHVVVTHKHPDHAGSLADLMGAAPTATGYAGAADLESMDSPRRLAVLADGDDVFGLQVVATPGHTAGHIAVFEPDTRVLVAGDALTNGGALAGSNPQFTEDAAAAAVSVRRIAQLEPSTILLGHGAPVTEGAAVALRALADSLA